MRADMRHRVTIKDRVETQDSYGQPLTQYTDICTVWASIEPLIGKEYFAAEQIQSEVRYKVRLWYKSGILPKMAVFRGDDKYEILSVINPKEQNRELLLLCKELV